MVEILESWQDLTLGLNYEQGKKTVFNAQCFFIVTKFWCSVFSRTTRTMYLLKIPFSFKFWWSFLNDQIVNFWSFRLIQKGRLLWFYVHYKTMSHLRVCSSLFLSFELCYPRFGWFSRIFKLWTCPLCPWPLSFCLARRHWVCNRGIMSPRGFRPAR